MSDDLNTLETESRKWIDKLGLYDWDCKFAQINKEGANGHCILNPNSRKATICLCEPIEEIVTIEEIAKHEVLEILLADVGFLLASFYNETVVSDELHKVINRLMVVLK
jgi:hypothetical protein